MTMDADVVMRLTSVLTDPGLTEAQRAEEAARLDATQAERAAAGRLLAADAVAILRELGMIDAPPPSLLDLTYRQVLALARAHAVTAHALVWLADELSPLWASEPTRTLADVAKVLTPQRLEYLRAELGVAGIALDGQR